MNHYPFLNPHLSSQQGHAAPTSTYEDRSTAQQQYTKIVEEVLNRKNKEKANMNSIANAADEQIKCPMHPAKASKTCRKCRSISETGREAVGKPNNQDPEYADPQSKQSSTDTFTLNCEMPLSHINEKIKKNIQGFGYFRDLYSLRTLHEVIEQIAVSCSTIETFQKGSTEIPTKFICLFYKLLLMRPVAKEIKQLIGHHNCYVRATGLLYVRVLCSYQSLYDWLSPSLQSEDCTCLSNTAFFPTIDKAEQITIGTYTRTLLTELDHYQLRLPRIPTKIDKQIRQKLEDRRLLQSQEKAVRTAKQQVINNQPHKDELGILAVVMEKGRKLRMKVKELGSKVLAWHPVTGEVVELQYQEVDLEDSKAKAPTPPPVSIPMQKKQEPERRKRSRSRSARKQKSRRRKHSPRRRQKHQRRSRRSSSSSSSSSSSRSSSSSHRNRRSSKPDSRSHRKAETTKTEVKSPVPDKLAPKVTASVAPPAIRQNINSLKANIKKLAASSQPSGATLPERAEERRLERYRDAAAEQESPQEGWKDPVLDEEKEQVLRIG